MREITRLREVIKKIQDCATINAQHDGTLQEEWEYILEVIAWGEQSLNTDMIGMEGEE